MSQFKSDKISSAVEYSYLPVGALIPIGGGIAKYSDTSYEDMGLIPCDGRSLDTTTYAELYAVIGYSYGGSGASFLVPDLKANKLAIRGLNTGETIGSKVTSATHNHTAVNMSWTSNNANDTHTHSVTHYIGNMDYDPGHGHWCPTVGANSGGANNTSSAANGSQNALVLGNHYHAAYFGASNFDGGGTSGHSHNTVASGNLGSTNSTGSHSHNSTASATWDSKTIDGTSASPLAVPYANMLYFIKA